MKGRNLLRVFAVVIVSCTMLLFSAVSSRAQGNSYLELDYARVNLENTEGYEAYFKGIKAVAETGVYNAIQAGVSYIYGTGGTIKMAGYLYGNSTYQDAELYGKIPINFTDIARSISSGQASSPEPSPFYIKLLYKMNSLKTDDVAGNIPWESASGGGIGGGFQGIGYKKLRFYGSINWFPQMNLQSAMTPLRAANESFYKGLNYGIGLQAGVWKDLSVNFYYGWESHEYKATVLHFSTLALGAGLKF